MNWHRRTSHQAHPLALLVVLAALSIVTSGCKPTGDVSYKPPFVPIAVSVNEKGELSVRFEASIVTPLGTFSLSVTPDLGDVAEGDGVVEFVHFRHGKKVRSFFKVKDFARGGTEIAVADGSGIRKSGDRKKTRIEIPRGAQDFTLEAEDTEQVEEPSTTSTSEWSEPPPTTTSPPATTSSEPPPSTTSSAPPT